MTKTRSFQLSRISFGAVGASRSGRTLGVVLGFLLIAVPPAAYAGTVVFAEDTTIGGGAYEGCDVVVVGCTLTINGAVSFNSLSIERDLDNHPGVVTYAPPFSNGLQITVATYLYVEGPQDALVGSRIDISGKGFTANQGPGAGGDCGYFGSGAGYGGTGGNSAGGCVGGGAYDFDSLSSPVQCGSGGGGWDGGAGGGAAKLIITGTATINGTLAANGLCSSAANGGGGSGGSIWLTCGTLAGSGIISANGGNAPDNFRGSGGGGRLAVYYTTSAFSGTLSAYGGSVGYPGGAGTVYTEAASQPKGDLRIDNNGTGNGATPLRSIAANVSIAQAAWAYPQGAMAIDGNLQITGGGVLTPSSGGTTLDVSVTGFMSVDANSRVEANGYGYPMGQGPGAGTDSGYGYGSGAGYGGRGGNSPGGAGGGVYGSVTWPTDLGSGGGAWSGGAGGGAIKLNVTGAATIDGTVTANGNGGGGAGGGGSGGSIWLAGGTIAGGGTISANGGNAADGYRGSGGGGRIALYTCNLQMSPAQISVTGGHGGSWGADGTVFHGSADVVITQQPAGGTVQAGDPVTLMIVASTTQGTLHYQWRKNGQNLIESPPHLTGTQMPTLLIDAALTGDTGAYDVLLTDDCGDFTSTAASLQVLQLGDMNCDGEITLADIQPFVLALADPAGFQAAYPNCLIQHGDMDGDGAVDGEDIGLFVRLFVP